MRRLRIPYGPEEGWATLALVAAMLAIVGWSIDDVGWVLGRTEWTDFLPWVGVLGVVVGFIGAKVGWNRWVAHAVGAAFAALIVPLIVGGVLVDGSLGLRYAVTAQAAVNAWSDLVVNQLQATRETGHYLLVLGMLCWATGQFAASAVFRHRRPLAAIVVAGALLVGNMAATVRDQLGYLILFSIAALFILIRLHALDEQATWLRRRIGDPTAVRSIYLRGGTVFVLIAVVGSLALTATARSSPLAGAWDDLKPWLLDVSGAIQRFLPAGADSRGIGAVQFGPNATLQKVWSTDDGLALTIQRTPGDERAYYWRALTYDRFDFYGWGWSGSTPHDRPAGTDILAGTLDEPPPEGWSEVVFTVTPNGYRSGYAVSPLAPVSVDRDAELIGLGEDGFFEALDVGRTGPYVLRARVPILGDQEPGGLTENILRVAGTDYPAEVAERYLDLPPDSVGPDAQAVLDKVLGSVANDNPYDVAKALVRELQSNAFQYDTNLLDVDCGDRSEAECFAWSRRGFCQQYATLMAVLLRQHQIPARFVQGFLPGDLDELTGVEEIRNQNAHAWVEVYFPGHGWVIFDPTGGNVAQVEPLPSGRPVASPTVNPSASFGPRDPNDAEGPDPRRTGGPGLGGGTTDRRDPPLASLIIVSLLLIVTVALLAFLAWRRGPRGPTTPDGAYAGVAKLAARFGFGPRPTQTAYEFASALGDVLPNIRPELQTVATAKVEVAYGRRTLGDDRIRALRESYRKLRVSLLRLLFRRRSLRRRR